MHPQRGPAVKPKVRYTKKFITQDRTVRYSVEAIVRQARKLGRTCTLS